MKEESKRMLEIYNMSERVRGFSHSKMSFFEIALCILNSTAWILASIKIAEFGLPDFLNALIISFILSVFYAGMTINGILKIIKPKKDKKKKI